MARRWADQSAMSLIEMTIAITLVGAIVAVLGPVMTSAFNSARVTQNESRAIDEIRIAIGRIDRELRSASCIDAPAAGADGDLLRFWTDATVSGVYGGAYEVTYAVDGAGRLTRSAGADTQYVGEGIIVTSKQFKHVFTPGQRAKVQIDLQVRFEESNTPRSVRTEIAGRNAWAPCSP